ASQKGHVEVVVPSHLASLEQVQCPAAADPPRRRESAHDVGDVYRQQRLPRPEVSEVADILQVVGHHATVIRSQVPPRSLTRSCPRRRTRLQSFGSHPAWYATLVNP